MDREESTNSSEEALDDRDHDEAGVGRSYECVFCKRGFNTAQALGGHMNIHRKDRARNKPNSTKQPLPRHTPENHFTYFPPAPDYESSRRHPSPDPPAVDPRDWRMRFSFEFAPSIVVEADRRGMEEAKELDLELRLGYDS